MSVRGVSVATPIVVIVKVAVVAPLATVTELGTAAAAFDEESATVAPEGPAALVSVTVPVEVNPPKPEPGEAVMLERCPGRIVRFASLVEPRPVEVMPATVAEFTAVVVTVKVAVVAPAGITMDAGSVALVEFDASVSVEPPVGAGLVMVTVPVELTPPATTVGDRVIELCCGGFTVRVWLLV